MLNEYFGRMVSLIRSTSLLLLLPSIVYAGDFERCVSIFKPGSYEEARHCFLDLAKRKVDTARATFALGKIYAEGDGVEPNLVEAYKWFIISDELESTSINKIMINASERELRETEIKHGRALAKQWLAIKAIPAKNISKDMSNNVHNSNSKYVIKQNNNTKDRYISTMKKKKDWNQRQVESSCGIIAPATNAFTILRYQEPQKQIQVAVSSQQNSQSFKMASKLPRSRTMAQTNLSYIATSLRMIMTL